MSMVEEEKEPFSTAQIFAADDVNYLKLSITKKQENEQNFLQIQPNRGEVEEVKNEQQESNENQ